MLGLVYQRVWSFCHSLRLTTARAALQTRYPINFVVKHLYRLVFFRDGPPWGGEKPAGTSKSGGPVSGSASLMKVAAIRKQRISLGGADRDRTGDLMLAKHALSQLSYSPRLAASF